jgi:hypothetical protein
MKKLKKHTAHSKRNSRRKTNESDWYFIDGKWITAEEPGAEISRNEAKISQIEEILGVCGQARKSTSDLIRLARVGNKLPVHVLWDIACDLVSALDSMAEKQPELVLPISRRIFIWPAFISHKRAFARGRVTRCCPIQKTCCESQGKNCQENQPFSRDGSSRNMQDFNLILGERYS